MPPRNPPARRQSLRFSDWNYRPLLEQALRTRRFTKENQALKDRILRCVTSCRWWFIFLSLHREQEWLLERLRDPAQEAGSVGPVDQTMVVGERQWQYQPRLKLVVHPDRFHAGTRKT